MHASGRAAHDRRIRMDNGPHGGGPAVYSTDCQSRSHPAAAPRKLFSDRHIVRFTHCRLQVSRHDMIATGNPQAPHLINGLRVFSVLGAYWLALFPAVRSYCVLSFQHFHSFDLQGLNLHLVTSIAFIVAQTITFRLPAVRRLLALPPVPPLPERKLPTVRDSLRELKNWYSVRMKEAQAKELERQRKMRMVQRQMPPGPGRK